MSAWLIPLVLLMLPAAASAEPYAVAKIIYAGADFPLGSPFNGSIDDSSPALGVDVGFSIGRRWGVEVGAARYGSFDGNGSPCVAGRTCTLILQSIGGNDMTIYNAAIVPRITAGKTRFFARAGYYRAEIDANIGLPGAGDFRADGLMLGVGARWYFADPWNLSLEATRFDDNVRQLAVGFGWGLRPRDERD